MICPYLLDEQHTMCKACGATYLPSASELDEYCRHSDHNACPFYRLSSPFGKLTFHADGEPTDIF